MKASEEIFHQKTDYKRIILNFLRYKYYFMAAVFFAFSIAYVINKYTDRKYVNQTTLLIAEEQNNSFLSSDEIMGSGLFSGIANVENELEVLRSFSIINLAVQQLNLEVTYGIEKNMFPFDFIRYKSETELYTYSPIQIILDQTHVQPVGEKFYLNIINDSTYKLSFLGVKVPLYDYITNEVTNQIDTIKINGVYKFGEKISNDYYSFSVYLNSDNDPLSFINKELFFHFNDLYALTGYYQGRLHVAAASTTSSIVIIGLSGSQPLKITDFLNTLTSVYLENSLEKKNKKAFSTVQFIDARISDIADSLSFAESKLQNFRSQNKVMDMTFQGQRLYERMNALEGERAAIVIQQQYYDYIKQYFEANQDVSDLIAPSSGEIQDPLLSSLISEMLSLNNQRMGYLKTNNSKNLFLKDLEAQILNLKNTILENIDYNSNRSIIQLQDIDSRIAKMNGQISKLPRTERQLIGMERQFKLNDAIYTFLLQKRAEAQIARASNSPDYEVIDIAYPFMVRVISPKTSMNYMIAIFLGLFFPFVIILARDFLNNKVSDTRAIELMTDYPIIGHVHHNKFKTKTIIKDYPKSPLADSFREIRTNLQFFSGGNDRMVILVTSSMSGEGKSFCSINLASVYALLGKKTLLLGFDLRRPALHADFELDNDLGITSYLIKNAKIDHIIRKTKIENLDIISAGPVPPNPVELIASEQTKILFEELKSRYDYIIIDSAPVGAVTDSYLLFNYADINIYAIRHNYTIKDTLLSNLKSIEKKGIKNMTLIVNDFKVKRNDYGYNYQAAYYNNDKKPGGIKKLFRSKNKS